MHNSHTGLCVTMCSISVIMAVVNMGFLCALALCALAETLHVSVGSDISLCELECPNADGVLELYCKSGSALLELHCDDYYTNIHPKYRHRLGLNISSGCCVLREAQKKDTCVYEIEFHSSRARILHSTPITVIEPVVISNITSNSSEPGSDISLHVLFSGEETSVTWEVDGGDVPARYQLRDQNRTLIIPSAQREDARKGFKVRVTNPVSERTWEHVLEIRALLSRNRFTCSDTLFPWVWSHICRYIFCSSTFLHLLDPLSVVAIQKEIVETVESRSPAVLGPPLEGI